MGSAMHLNAAAMERASRLVFLPIALLNNFSLFQYLATVYFRHRHGPRVHCYSSVRSWASWRSCRPLTRA